MLSSSTFISFRMPLLGRSVGNPAPGLSQTLLPWAATRRTSSSPLPSPPQTPVAWAEDLYRGIADCLQRFGGTLAGGETSSVPPSSAALISIAATGSVLRHHLTLRSTAKPGHALLVTGTLGGSRLAKHLSFIPRMKETDWLVSHFKPTAMMDLSDGLARDLLRLASASGCGFVLDRDYLPVTEGCTVAEALGDGEDFEILLAMEEDRVAG